MLSAESWDGSRFYQSKCPLLTGGPLVSVNRRGQMWPKWRGAVYREVEGYSRGRSQAVVVEAPRVRTRARVATVGLMASSRTRAEAKAVATTVETANRWNRRSLM